MRKFSMNLPEDLHKRLKHWCVDNDTEMGEVIRRLIEYFLSEESRNRKEEPNELVREIRPARRRQS